MSIDMRGTGILDAIDLMRPTDTHARGRTGEAGMAMTVVRLTGLREMSRKTWSEGKGTGAEHVDGQVDYRR
ncbi:MAG: hypothetical protein IT229_08265 [Flavobacteriales bacterium]|nr:hypothetical protein [Flavobacteriales bacterium]